MDIKSLVTSKVVWFNLIALLVLVAQGFGFGEFQVDPGMEQAAVFIIAVVNLVLRLWFTSQPVTTRAANKLLEKQSK